MTTSTNQVQTIRPNIKVTDPRYGLKTAAQIAYKRRKAQEERDAFHAARRDCLAKDRAKVQAKLDSLRSDIRKLVAQLETGVISGADAVAEAFVKLERLGGCERHFESDIARITDKIGASC